MITAAIVIGSGIVSFLFIGNLVDRALYELALKIAKSNGDPFLDELLLAPNRERHLILNIVRPVVSTLVIFGSGAMVIAWLQIGFWGALGSFVYFFFLTQIACLAGRRNSLEVAGWAMVLTMVCVVIAYNALA